MASLEWRPGELIAGEGVGVSEANVSSANNWQRINIISLRGGETFRYLLLLH